MWLTLRIARTAGQEDAPYLDAIRDYAARSPARLHVPGHKGGPGADPGLRDTIGPAALAHDIPALTWGIDIGPTPTPFEEAQRLAAEAWGARRTWFLVNGASQGNLATGLALAHYGERGRAAAQLPLEHDRRARPVRSASDVRRARDRRGARDRPLPAAGEARPRARADAGRGRRVDRLADLLRRRAPTCARSPRSPTTAACRSSSTRRGARISRSATRCPSDALAAGADLVISSTHKIVGSLGQSAMLHLGGRLDERIVDRTVTLTESTSPSSLLTASLDAQRRLAATHGRELIARRRRRSIGARRQIREIPGLDVLDERFIGRAGVAGYDPLRLAVDVRGLAIDGYELARRMRDPADIHLELVAHNVIVAVFGMAEPATPLADRFIAALREAAADAGLGDDGSDVRLRDAAAVGRARDDAARGIPRRPGGRRRRRRRRPHRRRVARHVPARASRTCSPASASRRRRSPTSVARSSSAAAYAARATGCCTRCAWYWRATDPRGLRWMLLFCTTSSGGSVPSFARRSLIPRTLLVAAAAGALFASAAGATSAHRAATVDQAAAKLVPAKIKAKRTLTIAEDASYAPNEFIGSDGHTVVGMDADLAKAIFPLLGLKANVVNATFGDHHPGPRVGQVRRRHVVVHRHQGP